MLVRDEDDDAGTRYGRASFALDAPKVKGGRWGYDPAGTLARLLRARAPMSRRMLRAP